MCDRCSDPGTALSSAITALIPHIVDPSIVNPQTLRGKFVLWMLGETIPSMLLHWRILKPAGCVFQRAHAN
jgi:hypothetical protein